MAVEPDVVYTLSGHVAFEGVKEPSKCNLRVLFRDSQSNILQMIDYPHHAGDRDFELDFPTQLKIRAPQNVATAEINLLLQGQGKALFDDIKFVRTPTGTITGQVTSQGAPLADAEVQDRRRTLGGKRTLRRPAASVNTY